MAGRARAQSAPPPYCHSVGSQASGQDVLQGSPDRAPGYNVDPQPGSSNSDLSPRAVFVSPVSEIFPEPEVSDAPRLPEIILTSRLTSLPSFSTWTMMALSVTVTSFTVYYSWNASFTSHPSSVFLWNQPDNTIFSINLLSYLSTVLVTKLINITCDQVRWAKSCNVKGLSFLSFLALSPATSANGLLHLLISPVPRLGLRFGSLTLERIMHRLWSFQRYSPV
jgi:hypothetical protein